MNDSMSRVYECLPEELRHPQVYRMITLALGEDLAPDAQLPEDLVAADVTSRSTIAEDTVLHARIFAKDTGTAAGLPVAAAVFKFVDAALEVDLQAADGAQVSPGSLLMRVRGPGRSMLVAERTALNFLGRMSGIASLTRRFVDAVQGTAATILDTRKTLPGFRLLDKYAVRMGGGQNHRMGLYDMAMVKDNHIDGAGSLEAAVARLRGDFGDRLPVEVEVKDLDELNRALSLPVDRIMLDNMSLDEMWKAVTLTAGRIPLEASGNVSLETVRGIAETGVDYISSGALTHSVKVFDISMRIGD